MALVLQTGLRKLFLDDYCYTGKHYRLALCLVKSSHPQDDEIAALRAIYDADYQQAEGAETSYSIMVRGESGTLSLELSVRQTLQ